MAEHCHTCKFSMLIRAGMFCRKNPPTIFACDAQNNPVAAFPPTAPDGWCGQYQEKGLVLVRNVQEHNGKIVAMT